MIVKLNHKQPIIISHEMTIKIKKQPIDILHEMTMKIKHTNDLLISNMKYCVL